MSEDTTWVIAMAVLLSVFLASAVSSVGSFPDSERSSRLRGMPAEDYGSPTDSHVDSVRVEASRESVYRQRRQDLQRAKDIALLLEAEVREICEIMEVVE